MSHKIRYAIVGAGSRSTTYIDAIGGPYRENSELVAICDPSPTRMAWHNRRIADQFKLSPIGTFAPDQFESMLRQARPEVVIITVPDDLHHVYAILAMRGGCDVICEKPVTIDAPKLRELYQAMEQTGRKLRVTMNARYMPEMQAVQKLLLHGTVGRSLAAELCWTLDTSHGADFFRRWHRQKERSGGLLVHKASHHFDLVNWFVGSYPMQVFAQGDLKFYGRDNAKARGESYAYDRYTGNPQAKNDPFAMSLEADETTRNLYLAAEKDSGYIRDRNVFGDGISIEDTLSLTARYRNGVLFTYSLIAYSPWEGLRLSITGTRGRVELYARYGAHVLKGDAEQIEAASGPIRRITVFPMFGVPYEMEVPEGTGHHGGADAAILRDLFSPDLPPDPFGCRATTEDAAACVLMGICANQSIASGLPVNCEDVFPLDVRCRSGSWPRPRGPRVAAPRTQGGR